MKESDLFVGFLLLVALFSVAAPVIVAILARRSPHGVRAVLAMSGIAAGIYVVSMHARVHGRGWGVLLLPFTTAALSFYLAFTGMCLLTVVRYVTARDTLSWSSLVAFGLLLGSVALGIFVVFPFVTSPLR